jgi:hypothetical protein
MIELDGAAGEGGGQILRSALALSMITGQPFRITRIRANRAKPGLMRQHLVAVQAAVQVSNASVTGAELGSSELSFTPGRITGGDYHFAIGSAGSCTLVLQTVVLALLYAQQPSTIRITGGTHNSMAPPVQFLQRTYLPLLARMGAQVDIELVRYGFYPAGGGEVIASVRPCKRLEPLVLMERGSPVAGYAEAFVAAFRPASVCVSWAVSVAPWNGTSRNCTCTGCRASRGPAMQCSSHSSMNMSPKCSRVSAQRQSGRRQSRRRSSNKRRPIWVKRCSGRAPRGSVDAADGTCRRRQLYRFDGLVACADERRGDCPILAVVIDFRGEEGRSTCVVKSTCQGG